MMNRKFKRFLTSMTVVAAAVVAAIAFRPKPTEIEAARAVRGPLQVTIDEDGETRARDRFTLSAPVAGRVSRITLREGDQVVPETIIATISPLPLDPRELAEIRARIDSAEARHREAEQQLARWETDHDRQPGSGTARACWPPIGSLHKRS